MAQFRTNHAHGGSGKGNKKGLPFLVKLIGYGLVLFFLLWKLLTFFKSIEFKEDMRSEPKPAEATIQKDAVTNTTIAGSIPLDWPSQSPGNSIIHHLYYTLSYSETNEQAEWVTYHLTRDQLNMPKVPRVDYFSPDLNVKTRSALHRDYTGSGYTRGHLAPAADMSFDLKAAEESFLMSNMSPQEKYFNQGIWRELEENVRDWTRRNKSLLVVTGPVLKSGIIKKIGDNRVSVPSLFYKVLLDTVGEEKKGIGFIIPNKPTDLELTNYMISIDSVEVITGINFYNANNRNTYVESLEKSMNKNDWPLDAVRYRKRVEEWNKK